MNNIGPFLHSKILELEELQRSNSDEYAEKASESIRILINYEGENASILAVGIEATYVSPQLIAGSVALVKVKTLADLPNVTLVELSKQHKLELDKSIPAIRANEVRTVNAGTHTWTGETGNGVVVGIIDSGINFEHKSFRKPNGDTRILAIWDLTLTPNSGESSPGNFNLVDGTAVTPAGVEYDSDAINDALEESDPLDHIRHRDATSGDGQHGTHVAGIAAGNGLQDDSCSDVYKYVGVAPEAEIIMVKTNNFDDTEVIQGIAYIMSKAASKPFVINMSFGSALGPHDGSEQLTLEIDRLISSGAGRVVVKSAGNEGNDEQHIEGTIAGSGTGTFSFFVGAESRKKIYLDLWYPAAGNLSITVTPNGETAKGPVTRGNSQTYNLSNGSNLIVGSYTGANNGVPGNNDNRILLTLDPNGNTNLGDNWSVSLKNEGASEVKYHCWLSGFAVINNATDSYTITSPGDGNQIITAGSFNSRSKKGSTLGGLSDFSSRGPTRDERHKPDITAPGAVIWSTKGTLPGCCDKFWCWCCNIYHDSKQGTSMAAPHVTGAIALILEKNPTLTSAQILTFLQNSAKKDDQTGDPPNPDHWGAGKLDIKAAMDLVPVSRGNLGPMDRNLNPLPSENLEDDSESPATDGDLQTGSDPMVTSDHLKELYQKLSMTNLGQKFSSLGETHADEIWTLVNHNKRVAVSWHRNGGKVVMQQAMNAIAFPDRPIPEVIADIPTDLRLRKIANTFYEYGSLELRRDIENYAGYLFPLIGLSIHEGIEKLEEMEKQTYSFEPLNN